MKRYLLIASLILLILSVSAWTQTRQQYEYKFENGCTESKANELGSEGWELVSIEAPARKIVGVYVFKRAK